MGGTSSERGNRRLSWQVVNASCPAGYIRCSRVPRSCAILVIWILAASLNLSGCAGFALPADPWATQHSTFSTASQAIAKDCPYFNVFFDWKGLDPNYYTEADLDIADRIGTLYSEFLALHGFNFVDEKLPIL